MSGFSIKDRVYAGPLVHAEPGVLSTHPNGTPPEGAPLLPSPAFSVTPAYLESQVEQWQGRMKLTHWEVKFDWIAELEDGLSAKVSWQGGVYDIATLQFAPDYGKWSRREANIVVAHELMHLVMRDLQEGVESAEDVLSASAYKLFNNRFEHELEGVVERVATMLVDLVGVL